MDRMGVEPDRLPVIIIVSSERVLHVLQSRRVVDCGSAVGGVPVKLTFTDLAYSDKF